MALETKVELRSSVPTFWVPDVARTAGWYLEHLGFRTAGTLPKQEPYASASLRRPKPRARSLSKYASLRGLRLRCFARRLARRRAHRSRGPASTR